MIMNNSTIYPLLGIYDPKREETIYSGYNIDEFFKQYNRDAFLECDIILWMNSVMFVNAGKVKDFKIFKRVDKWEVEK